MSTLLTARFHTTVAQLRQLPHDGVPEIAFIGRSNAGKSSAINVLCNRKRLAFSSRTPGRTQALNFFAVGRNDAIDAFLVDMPGYGYAAAPGAVRSGWDALAGRYLHERASLRGAVLMVDIRRELTDLDRRMLEWITQDVPLVVLVTKADKLGRGPQADARRRIVAQLREIGIGSRVEVLLFSATARQGIDEARAAIEALVHGVPLSQDVPFLDEDGQSAAAVPVQPPASAESPGRDTGDAIATDGNRATQEQAATPKRSAATHPRTTKRPSFRPRSAKKSPEA